jgi:prephenate dehydrogenase
VVENVTILGTGLIGTSVALALRAAGYAGNIDAWDAEFSSLDVACGCGADIRPLANRPGNPGVDVLEPGIVVLAGPVLSTLDWMEKLATICDERFLITDVGSTKLQITTAARRLYNKPGAARFLPGHPMAGKERGGADLAEATLFQGAAWLFTPVDDGASPLEVEWREWVGKFGARVMDLDAARHDEICAWVSHLPQMLSTALAALLEDTFGADEAGREEVAAIGGRALRETTRLGASPYSMWRDVALTNTEPIAATLHALEQRLAHVRENLRTPELREEFRLANEFRARRG